MEKMMTFIEKIKIFIKTIIKKTFRKSFRNCPNRCQQISKAQFKKPAKFQAAVSIWQFSYPGTLLYFASHFGK